LPDELVQHFNHDRLAREILEALVVQTYQAEKITNAEVGVFWVSPHGGKWTRF
jgi:hypothetical protein